MKIKTIALCLSLAAGQLLTSCEEKEVAPTPSTSLKALAGSDQDVLPNQPVTLDGSATGGADTKTFTWTIVKKPANSTVTLGQALSAKPTFTPDIVGYYEMELTVSSGTESSTDRVQVKAEFLTPVTLDSEIKVNTRLPDRFIDPTKPDYLVTWDIPVTAELTLDPGVVMAFERDKALTIENKGSIRALGSEQQRIRFTGTQAQKGFWAGIWHYSPGTGNALAFADIEYAGSRIAFTGTKAGLAVFGLNKSYISLTDCKFSNNDGYGMYVQEGSVLGQFARNTFSKHTEAPILIDAHNVAQLDGASTFTGQNGRDAVEIISSIMRGTQEVSWATLGDKTPYRLLGDLAVETGWVLQPGVIVEVDRDATISVNRNGYLTAKGAAENKVTIRGTESKAAYWKGMIVYSVSSKNVLEYAEISGGGSAIIASGQRATVTTYGRGAKLTVKNSRISKSGGYGIMYTSDADLNTDAGTVNTFEANAQSDLYKL